ncbi:PAS domain-containing protein [Mangrovicoccus sp. HB161399]|uniref:PAS domain-containing protein n=1 Tax=Mangrovicoccus sp. HB161399 TaxID=2720392 RepID=UPI0015524F41|nr:PAS domain-containing protein [Mangrovicoccus sp. HB161399]
MVVAYSREELTAQSISVMLGYLAQRTDLCAKVLNREGQILAINRRGLDQLKLEESEICGRIWAEFWTGAEEAKARAAVEQAFEGTPAGFCGVFRGTGGETIWDVEIFPLEWAGGRVSTVLALSADVTNAGAADGGAETSEELLKRFGDALHAMSNVSAVSASSARILRRRGDGDPVMEELAKGLEEAAEKAAAAVSALKRELL